MTTLLVSVLFLAILTLAAGLMRAALAGLFSRPRRRPFCVPCASPMRLDRSAWVCASCGGSDQ